jgi:hypothetical protein
MTTPRLVRLREPERAHFFRSTPAGPEAVAPKNVRGHGRHSIKERGSVNTGVPTRNSIGTGGASDGVRRRRQHAAPGTLNVRASHLWDDRGPVCVYHGGRRRVAASCG